MSKPAFQAATRCCADARAKSIRFMRDFPFGLMFMVQIKFSRSFPRFSSHRLVCQSSLSPQKSGFSEPQPCSPRTFAPQPALWTRGKDNSPVLTGVFMRFSFSHRPELSGANGQWRSEWFGTTRGAPPLPPSGKPPAGNVARLWPRS